MSDLFNCRTIIRSTVVLIFASAVFMAEPSIAEFKTTVKGTIYPKDESPLKTVLFTFERSEETKDGKTIVHRNYKDASGKIAIKEVLTYENGRVVELVLEQIQLSEKGRFYLKDGRAHFEYKKNGEKDEDDEKYKDNLLVSDEVVPYLRKNWSKLLEGNDVDIRYVVLDRKETVGFTFKLEKKTTWEGKEAILIKMSPSSIFIKALVKPLFFTMTIGDKQLQRLDGRTTPKIKTNNEWKDLDAVTLYDLKD